MKSSINNPAHKKIRIPEHIYIMQHSGQQIRGRQNLSLIIPRLNKIFNPLIHCTMEPDENVSETVLAGVVARENTINLLNHSNSNKMRTTKKMARKMLVFVAFLVAAGVGKAQENSVKAADATEIVSAGSEVKPVIVVPEILVKAMYAAKGNKSTPLNVFQGGNLWFSVTIINPSLPETTASNQRVTASPVSGSPSGACDPDNDGQICAVRLNTSTVTNATAYNALLARIGTGMPPTIQEFLSTGATYTTSPEHEYARLLDN